MQRIVLGTEQRDEALASTTRSIQKWVCHILTLPVPADTHRHGARGVVVPTKRIRWTLCIRLSGAFRVLIAVARGLSSADTGATEAASRVSYAHAKSALWLAVLEGTGGGAVLGVEVGIAALEVFGE